MSLSSRIKGAWNFITGKNNQRSFYDAAGYSRLTNNWVPGWLVPKDFELRTDLLTLQARARELYKNEPLINRYVNNTVQNVIGHHGFILDLNIKDQFTGNPDPIANKAIEEAFRDFAEMENCTVQGNLTLVDVQNLCLKHLLIDGEFIVRKVEGFKNDHNFSLQLIDPAQLDVMLNKSADQSTNGNEIRLGVEVDKWYRPVAYWIKKPVAVQFGISLTYSYDWDRVPAEEIIHGFISTQVGQTRGFPPSANVMQTLHALNEYLKSELTAATIASNLVGVLKSETGNEFSGSNYGGLTTQVPVGSKALTLEPGMFKQLAAGQDIQALDFNHPNNAFGEFTKNLRTSISAGLNIGYATLTNDTSGVNFSTMRAVAIQDQENYKALQTFIEKHLMDKVFSVWLEIQLLTGKILVGSTAKGSVPLPFSKLEKFNDPSWKKKRWAYINPSQDVQAQINAVNSGLQSRTSVVAEQSGKDYEEVLQEIAQEQKYAKELGVELLTSTLLQPTPAEEEPEPEEPQDQGTKPNEQTQNDKVKTTNP